MKSAKLTGCLFFTMLICGCSTTTCPPQNVSRTELREIEKRNEYSMSRLDEYLKDQEELRTLSLSRPFADRKDIDRKLKEIDCRRLRDVRELRDKIEQYENDLAVERAFYDLVKSGPY